MSVTAQIPYKIIVVDFYRRNIWWMLIVALAFFGLIQKPIFLHQQLMQYISSHTKALAVYSLITCIYAVHVLIYNCKMQRMPENDCLQLLRLLPFRRQLTQAFSQTLILLAPILLYTGFTILIAVQDKHWRSGILLGILLLFCIGINVFSFVSGTNGRIVLKKINLPFNHWKLEHYFYSYLLSYLWSNQRKKLLWIKIGSLLVLSIPVVRNQDHFDFGDFSIFWMVALGANLVVFQDIFRFFQKELGYLRQIPIRLYRFYLQILLTILCLNLPEIILIAAYAKTIIGIAQYAVYTIGIQTLLFHLQWEFKNDANTYIGVCGLILLLQTFLMPYKIFIAMGSGLIVLSYILFADAYYQYEYIEPEEKEQKST